MDLPPSGWYPDPYEAPGLLRWWDGAAWTEHTYLEATLTGAESTTVEPAATALEPAATTVEPAATVTDPAVSPVGPAVLSATGPPSGPPTSPQPAVPADYANGTQILPMDGTLWAPGAGWTGQPGPSWSGPGAPGGHYGPFRGDDRRRRILLAVGLTTAAAAAVAVIALVISDMNASATPPTDATNIPTAPATVAASASSAAATTPPTTPSPTSTASVSDASTGLTYPQLPAWAAGCPGTLNPQVFAWTSGESASAGTVNNGQTQWYGEACSGPLPAQYGYTGTADLQNVTNTLVSGFNGAYYSALPHNFAETLNQPVAVSGHPGWEIKFQQTYTAPQPGQAFTSETGAVVVTDPGNGAAPAVFFVSVPDTLNAANVDTLVSALQLTAPASPTSPATSPQIPAGGSGDT